MQSCIIHVTDKQGTRHTLEGAVGWRVMEVIRDYGLPIKAECGGCCACATCHVYVHEAWLDALPIKQDEEADMLDEAFNVEPHSRLSCQLILTPELAGLEVTLAEGTEP
jgi:ferredoxin, 2Fe-2S